MGFKKCMVDECLLMRKRNQGTVVVCVYIDDTLCTANKEAIQEFKNEIKNHFAIKIEGKMKEYAGCKIKK